MFHCGHQSLKTKNYLSSDYSSSSFTLPNTSRGSWNSYHYKESLFLHFIISLLGFYQLILFVDSLWASLLSTSNVNSLERAKTYLEYHTMRILASMRKGNTF
jgi:hypothetical protein